MPNWGISQRCVVFVVAQDEAIEKHYIECNQTNCIQTLLDCYSNLKAGKSLNEIQTILSGNSKRFETILNSKTRYFTTYKK